MGRCWFMRQAASILAGQASRAGAIESGGHQVVGFVALRQNKPAQSGRLGGGQGCAHPPTHPRRSARRDCSQREQFHLPGLPATFNRPPR